MSASPRENNLMASTAENASSAALDVWEPLYQRLRLASIEGIRFHGLSLVAARMFREHGDEVPQPLLADERLAMASVLSAVPVLRRVRESCDEPLVLMKGPEVAFHYLDGARSFWDLDILTTDARRVHRQLTENGFTEVGDPELYYGIHHLRPLQWESLPIAVEIHSRPKWPEPLRHPSAVEILRRAVPSSTQVEGIFAPAPADHVLLVAAHAWAHEPLHRVRDLVDVLALRSPIAGDEIEEGARRWQILRLWRATEAAAGAIVGSRRTPASLGTWARHLPDLRERTVLENHLQKWMSSWWSLPPTAALAASSSALWGDLRSVPEEDWYEKLSRSAQALRNARIPLSRHHERLGEAARRGQRRNPPDPDER